LQPDFGSSAFEGPADKTRCVIVTVSYGKNGLKEFLKGKKL